METVELKTKRKGWVAGGHWKCYGKTSSDIWRGRHVITDEGDLIFICGDFHYVKISHFITAVVNKGDHPCVAENTKILMADFTEKNIQDVKKGDKIRGD